MTHYKTESVHFLGLLNSATKLLAYFMAASATLGVLDIGNLLIEVSLSHLQGA